MSRPSGLLSLDDDVLLATFFFLDSKAALATASTSKRAYRLAISRVFADLSWSKYFDEDAEDCSESLALSRYMCAPEPLSQVPRIQHLRDFTLGFGTRKVDLPPLRSILCQAFNLRTIRIRHFESFIEDCDGLVTKAIGAMHHLEQADFIASGSIAVSALPNMLSSQKLTSLTLDFGGTRDDNEIIDVPALFSGLSSAPSIRTLVINFNYVPGAPSMCTSHNFALISVRDLTLSSFPGPVPAQIITFCPNINTLSLMLFSSSDSASPTTFSMSTEDRWPARLKRLHFPMHITIAEDTVQRMKPVDCLSFGDDAVIHGRADAVFHSGADAIIHGGAHFETFLPLLEIFRPTALELPTKGVLAESGRMWDTLRAAAPQLRSLSIVVEDGENGDVREYVDPLIAAVRSASLAHLSLEFPGTSGRDLSSMAHFDSLYAAEIRRVEALLALPSRLAEAVPSLRVLALSFCWPAPQMVNVPPELMAEVRQQDEILWQWGPDSELLKLPTLRRMAELEDEIPRDERWWWVEGEGVARTPIEIWREDGERARDLIQRADFDPEKGLDGFYSDKCRYEW